MSTEPTRPRSRRTRLVTVHNTTPVSVVYNSAGNSLAGGTSTQADPNDPRTAFLIANKTLYVKEG